MRKFDFKIVKPESELFGSSILLNFQVIGSHKLNLLGQLLLVVLGEIFGEAKGVEQILINQLGCTHFLVPQVKHILQIALLDKG